MNPTNEPSKAPDSLRGNHDAVRKPEVRVEAIFLSPGHNFFGRHGLSAGTHPLLSVRSAKCLAGKGLEGDRFTSHPRPGKGQITFFDAKVFEELRETLDVRDKGPGAFRRNVIVRGVDLESLVEATFEIQGILFRGTQSCEPCHWMEEAFAPGAEALLRGRGGLRADILTDGTLEVDP